MITIPLHHRELGGPETPFLVGNMATLAETLALPAFYLEIFWWNPFSPDHSRNSSPRRLVGKPVRIVGSGTASGGSGCRHAQNICWKHMGSSELKPFGPLCWSFLKQSSLGFSAKVSLRTSVQTSIILITCQRTVALKRSLLANQSIIVHSHKGI